MATAFSLQRDVGALTGLAQTEIDALFAQLVDAAQAREALNDVLPALILQYGQAAAAMAADWYDELRLEFGVAGRFTATPAQLGDPGAAALVGWAETTSTDLSAMSSLIAGGVARRVGNWARQTVMGSSLADPRASGWQRVARTNGCDFCVMLARRGAVYTQRGVNFGAHDDCNCGAAPKWSGRGDVFDVADYRKSTRTDRTTDAQREASNARARDWIANNL
ncbi:hypothetical protein [Nocardioides alkalitolerans]|uniref:VG15 protein n=1 Tax=Nocardioides alkalitolerans TaxID=281714 RepID=UPI0004065E81|nr:hypothetical protein [Nocardioides alkalitolerans]